MNIEITNVSMRYKDNEVDSVRVNFKGEEDDRSMNLNGYIPLTKDQYEGNEATKQLESIVREHVAQKITKAE